MTSTNDHVPRDLAQTTVECPGCKTAIDGIEDSTDGHRTMSDGGTDVADSTPRGGLTGIGLRCDDCGSEIDVYYFS